MQANPEPQTLNHEVLNPERFRVKGLGLNLNPLNQEVLHPEPLNPIGP